VTEKLKLQGKTVLSAEKYPLNDGGIALGQALIAASRYYKRYHSLPVQDTDSRQRQRHQTSARKNYLGVSSGLFLSW
jgi:hypothetical protein